MSNLNYHIYFTICDYSMIFYKKYSLSSSYINYCNYVKEQILNNKLVFNDSMVLIEVDVKLQKIFNLSPEQSVDYILQYFTEERYKDYEEIIMRTRELYKNCLN